MEECGPCPVFASFTLAFALQLRKKHDEEFFLREVVLKEALVCAESFTQLTKINSYSKSSQVLDRGEIETGAGGVIVHCLFGNNGRLRSGYE